jgi:hypothetical protein
MENNINDRMHTERMRDFLQSIKNEQTSPAASVGTLLGIIVIALGKLAALSLLTWLGYGAISKAFGGPEIGYIDMALFIGGARAFTMMVFDPIFSKKEKKQ